MFALRYPPWKVIEMTRHEAAELLNTSLNPTPTELHQAYKLYRSEHHPDRVAQPEAKAQATENLLLADEARDILAQPLALHESDPIETMSQQVMDRERRDQERKGHRRKTRNTVLLVVVLGVLGYLLVTHFWQVYMIVAWAFVSLVLIAMGWRFVVRLAQLLVH